MSICSPTHGKLLQGLHYQHGSDQARYLLNGMSGGKYDPLVEDAELLNANPTYATVRLQSGREVDVNLRDIAPLPDTDVTQGTSIPDIIDVESDPQIAEDSHHDIHDNLAEQSDITSSEFHNINVDTADVEQTTLLQQQAETPQEKDWVRRSTRQHKPVHKYGTSPNN